MEYKLMPSEADETMIAAGDTFMSGISSLGEAYQAMYEAAPTPPVQEISMEPVCSVNELMEAWKDDGASRGPAFCELRDLARQLEAKCKQLQDKLKLLEGKWRSHKETQPGKLQAKCEQLQGERDELLSIAKEVTRVGRLSAAGHEITMSLIAKIEAQQERKEE